MNLAHSTHQSAQQRAEGLIIIGMDPNGANSKVDEPCRVEELKNLKSNSKANSRPIVKSERKFLCSCIPATAMAPD